MSRQLAWLGFLAAWLACLIALVPMRWLGESEVWSNGGLSASGAAGTIWNGRLLGLRAGANDLGDMRAGLSAVALFGGIAAIALESPDGGGELRLGRERGLRSVSGTWPLAIRTNQGPVQLALSLEAFTGVFRGGRCFEAGGRVDAEITVPAMGERVPRMMLSGTPACREGVVEATLLPAGGSPGIELLVQVKADGHYRLTWLARSPDPSLRIALSLAGFNASPEGMARTDEGGLPGPGVVQE